MIKFKEGVSVEGIQIVTIQAMNKIDSYMTITTDVGMMVTSCTDGKHMDGSLHYKGLAFDLRTWRAPTCGVQMNKGRKAEIAYNLRNILGDPWQVIVEPTHIHIEYDNN